MMLLTARKLLLVTWLLRVGLEVAYDVPLLELLEEVERQRLGVAVVVLQPHLHALQLLPLLLQLLFSLRDLALEALARLLARRLPIARLAAALRLARAELDGGGQRRR